MKQKLVVLYLNDDNENSYEPLAGELQNGWRITSMVPVGAGVGATINPNEEYGTKGYVAGWLAILLEQP
ncbi:MAG: hypothetical protein ABSE73_13615 [Planctomycetota bacterium]